jgi:PIN domain nuclease of toxin-antitoxin system
MILLDTHTLIWFFSQESQLSHKALKTIETAKKENNIFVSAISVWEISMLVKKDKLILKQDVDKWLEIVKRTSYVTYCPIDAEIARQSVILPKFDNPDPADRIIIATARKLNVPIVTKDKKMHTYTGVTCIW